MTSFMNEPLLRMINSQAAEVVPHMKVVAKNMPGSASEGVHLRKMAKRPDWKMVPKTAKEEIYFFGEEIVFKLFKGKIIQR